MNALGWLALAGGLGGLALLISKEKEAAAPPGPDDKKTPPGGRPPGPTAKNWEDRPVLSSLSNVLVIGDGAAEELALGMAQIIKPPAKVIYFKTGTSLDQMGTESKKALEDYLAKRPNLLANNPFGLSLDVFVLSFSSNEDPAPLINELRAKLTKNDAIVWVPPFGNPELVGQLQATFQEARAAGNRVVGIIPTEATGGPQWAATVLQDMTAVGGIPAAVRI